MLKANIKINFNSRLIKKALKKTAWQLGQRAFISFIIFVFVALFTGGAIFYYYAFLAMTQEPEVYVKAIKLDEQLYQKFLDNYRQRREIFNNADSQIYFNPFFRAESPKP